MLLTKGRHGRKQSSRRRNSTRRQSSLNLIRTLRQNRTRHRHMLTTILRRSRQSRMIIPCNSRIRRARRGRAKARSKRMRLPPSLRIITTISTHDLLMFLKRTRRRLTRRRSMVHKTRRQKRGRQRRYISPTRDLRLRMLQSRNSIPQGRRHTRRGRRRSILTLRIMTNRAMNSRQTKRRDTRHIRRNSGRQIGRMLTRQLHVPYFHVILPLPFLQRRAQQVNSNLDQYLRHKRRRMSRQKRRMSHRRSRRNMSRSLKARQRLRHTASLPFTFLPFLTLFLFTISS